MSHQKKLHAQYQIVITMPIKKIINATIILAIRLMVVSSETIFCERRVLSK
jgi:hypothetical protein